MGNITLHMRYNNCCYKLAVRLTSQKQNTETLAFNVVFAVIFGPLHLASSPSLNLWTVTFTRCWIKRMDNTSALSLTHSSDPQLMVSVRCPRNNPQLRWGVFNNHRSRCCGLYLDARLGVIRLCAIVFWKKRSCARNFQLLILSDTRWPGAAAA